MKKFLVILLIAIVACTTVPTDEEKNKVLETLKKAAQLLKDNGYWDPLVKFLKATGLVVPKELCLKVFDEESCEELLGNLLEKPEDGEVVLNIPWTIIYKGIKYVIEALTYADAFYQLMKKLGVL